MFPNPILSIGDVHVYLYGLLIAIGILACFFMLFEYSKRAGIPNEYVDFAFYNGIVSIVIGFIGSAVWQGLFQYIEQIKDGVPNPQFSLKSGITAIGGLATGAITFIVICIIFRKKYPFALTKLVAVAPMCMLVAHGFGRLGCLMAGCCHGEYLGQEYVFGGIKMDGSQGWGYYVPTQLYEALFLLLLCALLSLLLLKRNFRFALPVYLAAYGIWRFLIEFARADDRGAFIGSLSPSQTLSLILIVLSVPAYFILKKFVNESRLWRKIFNTIKTNQNLSASLP
jgi:phosphatidylglycerol:prolipoprotein diacylglycerol transferase